MRQRYKNECHSQLKPISATRKVRYAVKVFNLHFIGFRRLVFCILLEFGFFLSLYQSLALVQAAGPLRCDNLTLFAFSPIRNGKTIHIMSAVEWLLG